MSVAWVGVAASVAGPLVSGMMAGDAASDAAAAQSAAADKASAIQEAARLQQRSDLMPWMQGGQSANNALLSRLGIGGGAGGSAGGAGLSRDQIRSELLSQFTRTTPGAQKQLAYNRADDTGQYAVYTDGTEGPYGEPAPGTAAASQVDEAGLNAAIDARMAQAQGQGQGSTDPNYGSLLAPAPAYKQFTQQDLDNDLVFQNTYKTALDTGTNALNSRAANAGGWGSGAALKALTRFGAQTANTYTGYAYNRNLGEQNNLYTRNMEGKRQTYNFLSGVSQQGQSAAAGVGAAGIATGNAIAGNRLASGNAQSAGIVGGANAMSGGIADATNAFQWNQLMSKKKPTASPQSVWGNGNAFSDTGDY